MESAHPVTLSKGSILRGKLLYEIDTVIGHGGFGITYRAHANVMVGNITHSMPFALKEYFPNNICRRAGEQVSPEPQAAEEFKKGKADFVSEAKRLYDLSNEIKEANRRGNASSDHHGTRKLYQDNSERVNIDQNIVKVNEVFEANGTAYYVMEYIEGVSLSQYVSNRKKLPFIEAVALLTPIMRAVDFLHSKRMNHLDIKPDNIMIRSQDGNRVPVLIDFGQCLHFNKRNSVTTPIGMAGVSDGYAPMEQYAGITSFSPQTDVYALTATLAYAITGKMPPKASDLNDYTIDEYLAGVVPPNYLAAFHSGLRSSKAERTDSVESLMRDLGIYAQAVEPCPAPKTTPTSKKSQTLIIVLAAAVVILVAVLIHSHIPSAEPPSGPTIEQEEETSGDTNGPGASGGQSEEGGTGDSSSLQNNPPDDGGCVLPPPEKGSNKTSRLDLGYGIWVGEVKAGKPHGNGTLTYTQAHRVADAGFDQTMAETGDYLEASYTNGRLDIGTLYDSNGNKKKTIIP